MKHSNRVQRPRRDERYETSDMSCPLGDVVNLSASGMQIRTPGKPAVSRGELKQFVLRTTRQTLTVSGSVVWMHRRSPLSRQYAMGVRFVDSRPAIGEALVAFAKYGFVVPGEQESSQELVANATVHKPSKIVEDYYRILGVERRATQSEIRRAFWALAKANHPDLTTDPNAEVRFRRANEAREVLLDPMKRRRFDDLPLSQRSAA